MFVSQALFKFDPGCCEQVHALARSIIGELRAVEGCRRVVVLSTAGDKLTSFVSYETLAQAEAATPTIAAFFIRLAPYLAMMPHRQTHPAPAYEPL